jgi:hypothetical protein
LAEGITEWGSQCMSASVPTRGMMTSIALLKSGNVNGRKYAAFDLVVCTQSFMIAGIIMMGRGG